MQNEPRLTDADSLFRRLSGKSRRVLAFRDTVCRNLKIRIEPFFSPCRCVTPRGFERRRGSNPGTRKRKCLPDKQLTNSPFPLSGNCQEPCDTECQFLSSVDAELRVVISAWDSLAKERKARILLAVERS